MNKFLKRLRIISLSLGVMATGGLIYNLILFAYLRRKVLNFEALGNQVEILGILAGLSLALIGCFHLCTVITLLLQITVQKSVSTLKILAGVIGVISGMLLLSDLAMIQDIGKEYQVGWDTSGEWTILFINHGLHTLFTVLAFLALMVRGKTEESPKEIAIKDDTLFVVTHTTGLLCGGLGLVASLLALAVPLQVWIVEAISVPIGLLVLLPYLFILGIWLFTKRREKVVEWFDEKQSQDTSKAGLWTLIVTLPCMVAIGILQRVNGPGSVWNFIWLPLYIFLVMTAFSSATLYWLKR